MWFLRRRSAIGGHIVGNRRDMDMIDIVRPSIRTEESTLVVMAITMPVSNTRRRLMVSTGARENRTKL